MEKIFLVLLILVSISKVSFAKSSKTGDGPVLIIGGNVSRHEPTSSEFKDIYSSNNPSYGGVVALGYSQTFLVGKYREFKASGKSKLENISVEGDAAWKQKITFFGLRVFPEEGVYGVYADIGAVFTEVKETIVTKGTVISQLSGTAKTTDTGFGVALGINIPIISRLAINGEIEYANNKSHGNGIGGTRPDIGGLSYGIGLNFIFGMEE